MITSTSVGYVDNYSYFITIVLMYNMGATKGIKQNCFQHPHYLRLAQGWQTRQSMEVTIRMAEEHVKQTNLQSRMQQVCVLLPKIEEECPVS